MFVPYVPDLPPQYAPVLIAQASPAQKGSTSSDATIGICQLIENPPDPPGSAVNGLSPLAEVGGYLKRQKRFTRQQLTAEVYNAAKVSIPERPRHGRLENVGAGEYYYYPTPGYFGADQATLGVEMAGLKINVVYFFNVLPRVGGGGTEGYDPHDDKKFCPQGKGRVWKYFPRRRTRREAPSAPRAGKLERGLNLRCASPRLLIATSASCKWDTSSLRSSYANFCNANSTREEVVLNFGVNKTWERGSQESLEIELNHRIVRSPFAAKRLAELLNKLMQEYESRYGALPEK